MKAAPRPPSEAQEPPDSSWPDGFKQDVETRLECVKHAVSATGHSVSEIMPLAREMYQFVIGETCAQCGASIGDEPDGATVQ